MSAPAPRAEARIHDLGMGAGFALWGFRACAGGHGDCPALHRGFSNQFGGDAPEALDSLRKLAVSMGYDGRRRIVISRPGHAGVTADELSVVAALAAVQNGDPALRDAHLTWLFVCEPPAEAIAAAGRAGRVFALHGLIINPPGLRSAVPPGAPVRQAGGALHTIH